MKLHINLMWQAVRRLSIAVETFYIPVNQFVAYPVGVDGGWAGKDEKRPH